MKTLKDPFLRGLSAWFRLYPYPTGPKVPFRRYSTFKIAIHDPRVPADLRSGGVELQPGFEYTVR